MAGAVVIIIFGSFFAKIVFDHICKNRNGTARVALLRDSLILAAGTAGAVVILNSGNFVKKLFSIEFTRIVRAR